jgi:hypothetical protein
VTNNGVHYKRLYYESSLGQQPKQDWMIFGFIFIGFVTEEMDEGKPVGIFYLDFAKAFDKVPRQRKKMRPNW